MSLSQIIRKDGKIMIRHLHQDWEIHHEITVHESMVGGFCDVLETNDYRGYVRRFVYEGFEFHKEMEPYRPQTTDDPDPIWYDPGACDPNRFAATAPYNFVPLQKTEELVLAEADEIRFDTYQSGKNTGYIDLEIICKTPVFSRGEQERFSEVDGKPALMGSTLRGLVRSLVETVSYGQFLPNQSFTNLRLYNRSSFEENSNVKGHYIGRMNKFETGFLNYDKETQTFFILPSRSGSEPDRTLPQDKDKRKEFTYISTSESGPWEVWSGFIGKKKKKQWIIQAPVEGVERIYLSDEDEQDYREDKTRKAKKDMQNILDTSRKLNKQQFPKGLPIFYTTYQGSEGERIAIGHTRFFRMPYGQTIADQVPDVLRKRSKQPDLAGAIFGFAGDNDQDEIQAGRVYFQEAVADRAQPMKTVYLRPLSSPKPTSFQLYLEQQPCGVQTPKPALRHWDDNDTQLRGYKGYWHTPDESGEGPKPWEHPDPVIPVLDFGDWRAARRLIGQHGAFLEAVEEEDRNGRKRLKEVKLKGSYADYPEALRKKLAEIFFPNKKQGDKKKVQFKPITPVPTGTSFSGKIRFENLSDVELGALLFVLDLDGKLALKIGMGKPLGLGSIQIRPTVWLSDRRKRYESLFGEEGEWKAEDGKMEPEELAAKKNAFAAYIGRGIGKPEIKTAKALWEEERMKALRTLLTFQPPLSLEEWRKRTAYGVIPKIQNRNNNRSGGNVADPFRDRYVLPTPEEAVDPRTKYHP